MLCIDSYEEIVWVLACLSYSLFQTHTQNCLISLCGKPFFFQLLLQLDSCHVLQTYSSHLFTNTAELLNYSVIWQLIYNISGISRPTVTVANFVIFYKAIESNRNKITIDGLFIYRYYTQIKM